ncbi:MAG: hypothetical protein E7464_05985 [Ruminococcaceae bacterium]|nr:hypothetical protein [Oscillospiraceae bacterium]
MEGFGFLILLGLVVLIGTISGAVKKKKRAKALPPSSAAEHISLSPGLEPAGKPVDAELLYEYSPRAGRVQCPGCHCENQPGTVACEVCGVPL